MPPLKLGFALEGNSDYPVVPRLVRRTVRAHFPDVVLAADSVLRPRKRGHGFIKELPAFIRQLRDDGVDIAVAVVDTDNTLIGERGRLLQAAKARCTELGIATCIADGLAVRALEAWLLADEATVFSVFDGDRASILFPSPERDPLPKNTLNQIVRTLTDGREVSFVSFADKLADEIDLPTLRRKCPHFEDFADNLITCVRQWQGQLC